MRDLYKEYRKGMISWDEAFMIANNNAALASSNPYTPFEETDYWAKQMESLGVDAAEHMMLLLGYKQSPNGLYAKNI